MLNGGMQMSTPTFEFNKLVNLLRRSQNDPAIRNFFGEKIGNVKRDEYYGWLNFKPEGVEVVFNEAPWVVPPEEVSDPKELRLAAFHLYREGHEGFAGYTGQLPSGVALGDTEAEVLRKLGQPFKRGGGGMSATLNRPIPPWFSYILGDAILRFQLDPSGRVEMATLQIPDVKTI
jgi:hypothetical protein